MVEKVQGEVVGVAGKNVKDETLAPVITTAATVKKQSGLKRLWKGFFAEDFKTVRTNVMDSVIKPSIKSGIANAITSAVYMWLFGKNGYSTAPGGIFRPFISNGVTNNPYNVYRVQNGQVVNNSIPGAPKVSVGEQNFGRYTSAEVYDPEYIRYASFEDANNVLTGLCDRIARYNVATVKNLFDLSGMQGYEMVLQNWGWYNFDYHRILPVGDGTWILRLPPPTALNGPVKT